MGLLYNPGHEEGKKGKKVHRKKKKRNNYNLYEETTHDQGESAISTSRGTDILRT